MILLIKPSKTSGQSSCAVIVLISLCGLRRILWVLSPWHTTTLRPMQRFFSWSDATQTEPFTCCLTQSYLTPLYSVLNKKVLNGKTKTEFSAWSPLHAADWGFLPDSYYRFLKLTLYFMASGSFAYFFCLCGVGWLLQTTNSLGLRENISISSAKKENFELFCIYSALLFKFLHIEVLLINSLFMLCCIFHKNMGVMH